MPSAVRIPTWLVCAVGAGALMDDRLLADRYKLTGDRHVGRQGTILHALDTLLGRKVAIKLGRSGEDQDSIVQRAMLIREAKYLARFEHPNIVSLFDFFQLRDAVGFVMPYLGANLAQTVARHKDLDIPSILSVLRNVAQALDFCAERGVAHRDVKPANILIGPDATAFLCDFGIAAEFGSADHWDGVVGTEPFIAPEGFLGAHEDPRRQQSSRRRYDQFGLGVTIYQVLTGRIPFGNAETGGDRKDTCTALQLIKRKSFPPCHILNEKLPRTVNDVVARMISVDPEDRYPTNVEAIAALDRAAAGYASGPQRVFLSYARAERAIAEELGRHLQECGLQVWWDRALVAGVDWSDQIEEAMESSDLMIVVLSPNSAYSSEVKLEWGYWLDALQRPLISLVVEDCRIPYRLFSHQHLIMRQNTGSDLVTVAADISDLIPKVFATFQAAARRTAYLRPPAVDVPARRPGEPDNTAQISTVTAPHGPAVDVPTSAAAARSLDNQPTPASGPFEEVGSEAIWDGPQPDFEQDATIFATAVRRDLEDYQTAALVVRRKIEDFATRVQEATRGVLGDIRAFFGL
jgi:hypothetical protein